MGYVALLRLRLAIAIGQQMGTWPQPFWWSYRADMIRYELASRG
jgi:hypothetical protein